MGDVIKFGLGFVTGRPNVCQIINNTYYRLIKQVKNINKEIELNIFILFDLGYQYTTRYQKNGFVERVEYYNSNTKIF